MKKKALTAEQRAAIKLQQDKDKYQSHCKETLLFTNDKQNFNDFKELIKLTERKLAIEKELKSLREKILENMNKCHCIRAINYTYGKQLTVSQSGRTSVRKEFDVDRFKSENPELYEKYRFNTGGGWSNGGRLVLGNITEKSMDFYDNDKELFEYEKPQCDCGDVFWIREFKDMVRSGCITDYDGFGEYLTDKGEQMEPVHLKDFENGSELNYNFVVWYNK